MPISSRSFARSSLILIFIGLVTLIGIVSTTVWLAESVHVHSEEVFVARAERRAAVDLRNRMLDVQSSQRGYLITGEAQYLEPYMNAVEGISPGIEALSQVLAPYPDMTGPMDVLRNDIEAKLFELSHTIELADAGRTEEAIAIVRTDAGEELMGRIRSFLDSVIDAADARTVAGIENQRNAMDGLRIIALVGALIIIAVGGGAALLVWRYTRELDTARDEVEGLNRDLEARVAERTVELRRANEEVQRFAYIVTHDLRAPLVNIMGFTSELDAALAPIGALIERESAAPEDRVLAEARQSALEDLPEAIGFIRSSTRKMDGLINAILKISREGRRELKADRIALGELIEATVAAVHHQVIDNEGDVTVDVQVPPVFSDKLAIEQIVGNLLDNAIKYRHPSRPIAIEVTARQQSDGMITIAVADNGRGIDPKDHERVFELFRRAGSIDTPGEGIGLAHVRIMCRNLGGDITVASNPQHGTTFTVAIAPDLRAIARSKQVS